MANSEEFVEREIHFTEQGFHASVSAQVLSSVVEHIRCVRLATGQVVYEFWTDGTRGVRIDALAYDHALKEAREHIQDEAPYPFP